MSRGTVEQLAEGRKRSRERNSEKDPLRCTCGKKRARIVRTDGKGYSGQSVETGEAWVCVNAECGLMTDLSHQLLKGWSVAARQ